MKEIVFDSRPAWRSYWAWFVMGLILLPVFGLGVVLFLGAVLDRWGRNYTIGNGKAEVRRGIIAKNLRSVRLENLRDIELNQTIMERILGIGSLGFSTAGSVGAEVIFTGVLHPQKVKDQVEEFLRQ